MGKILFPKYFPSCPTDGAEYIVDGFTDALTSNIENTMTMFWRPRKIKLSGSYLQFAEEPIRGCLKPANYELIIQSPYGSEEEMICEPNKQWTLNFSNNIYDPESAYSWDSKPFYKDNEESLFTFNRFDFLLDAGTTPRSTCARGVLVTQLYPTEEGPGGPFDYQTISILGVDFNTATYISPEFPDSGYIVPAVEVTEWWSFGGTYDTTTGEPL